MARPRKKTYPMSQYLENVKEGYILNDADTQRNPAWKSIINGLIVTVLTDDYIPSIILAEEDNSQLHIADGGSRTAALRKFRHGNYKISSSVEDSVIHYKKRTKDKSGKIILEDSEFDIRNKTFDQLPKELQKNFDEYQIETVIHEHCDKNMIATYIKRYNEHSAMNANQKMFIYLPKHAGKIREIIERPFFINHSDFKDSEKEKGVLERVVMETTMCMFHLDNWNKQGKKIATYLNKNSSEEEFDKLEDNLKILEGIVTDDIKDVFNSKDCFIWLTLFNNFTKLGAENSQFADFLRAFKSGLRDKPVDGKLFDTVDEAGSTKDKTIILAKIHILESLMKEFLHIDGSNDDTMISKEEFISKNVNIPIEEVEQDMNTYEDTLTDLENNTIRDGSKLLNEENRLSLLAMVAYSYKNEVDLDKWMEDYATKNNTYFVNQTKNYLHMVQSFISYRQRMATA